MIMQATQIGHGLYRRSQAFTLMEFVVCATIIAILASLATLAIASAREAARRASCQSSLRQIGIALHEYENRSGFLPSVGRAENDFSSNPWLLLATELEYEAVAALPHNQAEAALLLRPIILQCPSDGMIGQNYRMNVGSGGSWLSLSPKRFPDEANGPVTSVRRRLADVSGGLSNTAFASERLIGFGYKADRRSIGTAPHYRMILAGGELALNPLREYLQSHWETVRTFDTAGRDWRMGSFVSSLYDQVLPPNCKYAATFHTLSGGGNVGESCNVAMVGATSNHPGGVNVTRLDGSVDFVGDQIDPEVWHRLGSIFR